MLLAIVVDRLGPRLEGNFSGGQDRVEDAEDRQPESGVFGILPTENRASVRVARGRFGGSGLAAGSPDAADDALTTFTAAPAASASTSALLGECGCDGEDSHSEEGERTYRVHHECVHTINLYRNLDGD